MHQYLGILLAPQIWHVTFGQMRPTGRTPSIAREFVFSDPTPPQATHKGRLSRKSLSVSVPIGRGWRCRCRTLSEELRIVVGPFCRHVTLHVEFYRPPGCCCGSTAPRREPGPPHRRERLRCGCIVGISGPHVHARTHPSRDAFASGAWLSVAAYDSRISHAADSILQPSFRGSQSPR